MTVSQMGLHQNRTQHAVVLLDREHCDEIWLGPAEKALILIKSLSVQAHKVRRIFLRKGEEFLTRYEVAARSSGEMSMPDEDWPPRLAYLETGKWALTPVVRLSSRFPLRSRRSCAVKMVLNSS